MEIVRLLIRFFLAVVLSTAPLAASAMSMHDTIAADAKVSVQSPSGARECSDVSAANASSDIFLGQSEEAPSDGGKANDHCGACCLSSCAKHLTAAPPSLVQVMSTSTRVKQPLPDAQRVSSLEPDPARKPPRI